MAMLADMEELLGEISNADVKKYMMEAYACYGAGAYRGCIVLSYIAVFDDIRLKLAELAKTNSQAKKIWVDIKKLGDGEKVFENPMIEQLTKQDLMTVADRKQLEIIQSLRNSAAHPSGIEATAEQARMVYSEVIRRFLANPILRTTLGADRVIDRLSTANLFPTANAKDIKSITEDEIRTLNPSVYPYLVKKLVEGMDSWTGKHKTNGTFMLFGLAQLKNDVLRQNLKTSLISGKSNDPRFSPAIVLAITADGDLAHSLPEPVSMRVCQILKDNIDSSSTSSVRNIGHPAMVFNSMVGAIGWKETKATYGKFADLVLKRFPYADPILNAAVDSDDLFAELFEIWTENAQSGTFETANAFVDSIELVDAFAENMTDSQALTLLASIVGAARHGAWRAKELRDSNFVRAPDLRAKAEKFMSLKKAKSKKIIEDIANMTVDHFEQYLA
ncbi:hypothetical protein [Hyphomonas oceanitis]|uniref:hypothetical protein n=1 Tax=Hyphomonas oceanitis TaxID=81033 RepID=UPI003003507A